VNGKQENRKTDYSTEAEREEKLKNTTEDALKL
jgi:hypothetical protein